MGCRLARSLRAGTPSVQAARTPALHCSRKVAATADLVFATDDAGDGLGVGEVFFGENAGGEGVSVVGVEYRDGALEDDDAVVEMLIDEVDGAAGEFDTKVQCLLLRLEAGESG